MAAFPRQLSLFGPSRPRPGGAQVTPASEVAENLPVQKEAPEAVVVALTEAAVPLTPAPAPRNTLLPDARSEALLENGAPPARSLPTKNEVFPRAESIAYWLSKQIGVAVRLAITDNRSTMVSFRRGPRTLQLRLHHMFLEAPEQILQAVADYAWKGKREAGPMLDEYIRRQQERIRLERTLEENELEPRGTFYDLQVLFDEINAAHFDNKIRARIGWGRAGPRRRRKSIRLGVYDHQAREIRIHPALDRSDVPRFFVAFIVFHEMLHQLFPSPPGPGRKVHHPKAFRAREQAFPLYGVAIRWEKENLLGLLRG